MLGGVAYERIDDTGLQIRIGDQPRTPAVDTVVICAGQDARRDLADALEARGVESRVVGGAPKAAKLDAKRAIREAAELAASMD